MELFSLIFLSFIGLLILILNGLLWFKVRRFDKIIRDPSSTGSNKILFHKNKEELQKLDKDVQELYEINSRISKIAKRGICKAGVMKFNAFSEKSGNQSFAIALLDFRDNGVVLSNLQNSRGSRLFVKAIRQGEAANGAGLLVEEKKALERAKQVVF